MDSKILIEQVKVAASAKGVTPNKAFTESGVGKDFFYNVRKGKMPSIDKVAKLANFLGVTTDYLLGNEQKNKPDAERDELIDEIMQICAGLPKEKQLALLNTARCMIEKKK